jgi:DNA repair protein SbcD/Mre11
MTGTAFKFLHAGDFRLHQVVHGLSEIPEPWRDTLLEAPFAAVRQVVETALAEQVALVVLSGNLLQPLECGTRGIAFLLHEMHRLEQAGIHVYWSTGAMDAAERWPAGLSFPRNVTRFGEQEVTTVRHSLGGDAFVSVSGRSGPAHIDVEQYSPPSDAAFHIAVACGKLAAESIDASLVQYWALGGQMSAETVHEQASRFAARYAGSPQGRSPGDSGPHGCWLIEVDEQQNMQSRFVATDAVRWHTESLRIPQAASASDALRLMRERIRELPLGTARGPVLVQWRLTLGHRLAGSLRHGPLGAELLRALNEHLNHLPVTPSAVWSMGLEAIAEDELPEHLYHEETILGDFLRAVRSMQSDRQPMRLEEFLGGRELDKSLHDLTEISDPRQREQILRDVALMGAELLRGEG